MRSALSFLNELARTIPSCRAREKYRFPMVLFAYGNSPGTGEKTVLRRAYFQGGGIPQLFQLVVSAVGKRRVGPKLPLG